MKRFIINPITTFIKRFVLGLYLEIRYFRKHLKLGPMSYASKTKFGNWVRIYDNSVLTDVEIGDYSFVANDTQIARTKIGKFCSIGSNVKCGLGNHPSKDFVSTHPIFYSTRAQNGITFADGDYFEEFGQIEIGNDVWICDNAVIIDGTKIGDGAIIAAGAVVTNDVPAYAIVGGVPAKIIRYRFSNNEIKQLLKFKWWNKDEVWLRKNFRKFHNIKYFLDKQKTGSIRF